MGLLVAFLKGLCRPVSTQMKVEDQAQEVGTFDVDLGGNTQDMVRKNFYNLLL